MTEPPEIDARVPNSARIWNYWLGGEDNYPVDREAGDDYRALYPEIVDVARTSRRFLTRAVRYLAGEAGIRQFLDIGIGLPTADNTHQVAQRVAPTPGSSMSTTTRWSWPTPGPCSPAPEGSPPMSTPTCATPTGSWR